MNKFLNKDFTMKKSSLDVVREDQETKFLSTKDEFNILDKKNKKVEVEPKKIDTEKKEATESEEKEEGDAGTDL